MPRAECAYRSMVQAVPKGNTKRGTALFRFPSNFGLVAATTAGLSSLP